MMLPPLLPEAFCKIDTPEQINLSSRQSFIPRENGSRGRTLIGER